MIQDLLFMSCLTNKGELMPDLNSFLGLDDYQDTAFETAIFPTEVGPLYCSMGILGEAGELGSVMLDILSRIMKEHPEHNRTDLPFVYRAIERAVKACKTVEDIKKKIRKREMVLLPLPELSVEERTRIKSEGGDGLWYAASMAKVSSLKLSEVAQENIRKLRARKAAGVIAAKGETIEERIQSISNAT